MARHTTLWCLAAAALVVGALLQLAGPAWVQLTGLAGGRPAARHTPATLPDPFPAYTHLAASAERAPTGPALMAFSYGLGVEFLDTPHAVVLGADGTTYRHLRTAERASTATDQGDPGPMLISPDGTAVAIGTNGGSGALWVVDLLSGERTSWAVREGSSVHPAAWSSDARQVFVTTSGGQFHKNGLGFERSGAWGLHRVDRLAPGVPAVTLPHDADSQPRLAPLPDGQGMLIAAHGVTELRTADGEQTLIRDTGVWGTGLTSVAVSPDGTRVATMAAGQGLVEVTSLRDGRATGLSGVAIDADLDYYGAVLGWLPDGRVLVSGYDNDTDSMRLHLYALDLDDGALEELLVAEPGWTGAAVMAISVAGDLLEEASVGPVGVIDRGYLDPVLEVTFWLLVLLLVSRVGLDRWRRRVLTHPAPHPF